MLIRSVCGLRSDSDSVRPAPVQLGPAPCGSAACSSPSHLDLVCPAPACCRSGSVLIRRLGAPLNPIRIVSARLRPNWVRLRAEPWRNSPQVQLVGLMSSLCTAEKVCRCPKKTLTQP